MFGTVDLIMRRMNTNMYTKITITADLYDIETSKEVLTETWLIINCGQIMGRKPDIIELRIHVYVFIVGEGPLYFSSNL